MANTDFTHHSHIALDACTVLSLYATYRIQEIVAAISSKFVITEYVLNEEVKYIFDEDGKEKVRIHLQPFIKNGDILIADLTDNEMETALNFMAEDNEDGEAFTGAIAFHRDWAIATDENKALTFFRKRTPQNQLFTTLDIIKYWTDSVEMSTAEISKILRDIQVRRGYKISRNHHLQTWWANHI